MQCKLTHLHFCFHPELLGVKDCEIVRDTIRTKNTSSDESKRKAVSI